MLYINGNDLVKRQKADDAQSIKGLAWAQGLHPGSQKKTYINIWAEKNVYNIRAEM